MQSLMSSEKKGMQEAKHISVGCVCVCLYTYCLQIPPGGFLPDVIWVVKLLFSCCNVSSRVLFFLCLDFLFNPYVYILNQRGIMKLSPFSKKIKETDTSKTIFKGSSPGHHICQQPQGAPAQDLGYQRKMFLPTDAPAFDTSWCAPCPHSLHKK